MDAQRIRQDAERASEHTREEAIERAQSHVQAVSQATSVMLGEAGLCLAFDELPELAGILTPASAMGDPLTDRLRRAGLTIEVERA